MVKAIDVKTAIQQVLPDAEVTVEDLNGGGDHLQVRVVSNSFHDLSLIKQHQIIYGALKDKLADETIHALAINTSTPD